MSRALHLKLAILLAAAALFVAGMPAGAADAPATTPATTPATKAAELAIVQADAGKILNATVGQTVTISLAGNPTTGYSWRVTSMEGTALEQAGEVSYVKEAVPAGVAGSGGKFVATFRAVKAGQTKISLAYQRPFEGGNAPSKTFDVTVLVEAPTTVPATTPTTTPTTQK